MLDISRNQIITLHRGDTFSCPIIIYVGNKIQSLVYNITDGDTLYVGIMEANQKFEDAIIKKVYTKEDANHFGDVTLKLESDDTICLLPGTYYYQVKLESNGNSDSPTISTVIPRRKLFLVD